MNITDDHNDFVLCTDNETHIDINVPTLLPTIACGLSFLCLLGLLTYTLFKLLITNK